MKTEKKGNNKLKQYNPWVKRELLPGAEGGKIEGISLELVPGHSTHAPFL